MPPRLRATAPISLLLLPLASCRPLIPDPAGFLEAQDSGSTSQDSGVEPGSTGPASTGPESTGTSGLDSGGTNETSSSGTESTSGTTDTGPDCGDGIAEGEEECDGADLGGASCESEGFGAGTLGCLRDCSYDTSECITCGNDLVEDAEVCDGTDLVGNTCIGLGLGGGMLGCLPDCSDYDVSACTSCGNGIVDGPEVCDGPDLGGGTCLAQGFDGGVLACTGGCSLDTSGCYLCGDGSLDPGEQCDDAGESAVCDVDCTPVECGDGLPNATEGEECDDAGESVACDDDCTFSDCGDALLNVTAGEQCDDGDPFDDDSCSNACTLNDCTFDVASLPLLVHPGNSYGELDFDGSCNLIVAGSFTGNLYRITPAGVVSVLAAGLGPSSINGVAYRASDDLVYLTTDGPSQLWSVSPGGVTSLVMALPQTINAIEVAPPGFGAYGDRIMGAGVDGSVHAIDPAAGSNAVVGTVPGIVLSSLVFDRTTGLLYVASNTTGEVLIMDAGGAFASFVGGLEGLDGLAIDPGQSLFMANSFGIPAVTTIDLITGVQSVLASPALDGGYYVTGLRFEAGGNLLMKVEGASIDYVTP
jgi:cysteine-rich repeat protein